MLCYVMLCYVMLYYKYTVSDEPMRTREKCYPPVWLLLIENGYSTLGMHVTKCCNLSGSQSTKMASVSRDIM